MADIAVEIKNFLDAKFGEDVRRSFVDCINKLNASMIDKEQGAANAGKIFSVDPTGKVVLIDPPKSGSGAGFSGDYNDLLNKPTIPSKMSQLTNDAGYAKGTEVAESVTQHDTNVAAHADIRQLITELANRLNTVANSDDVSLDQLSEIVAYIKSNKTLIEQVTTNKVNVTDIVDDLTSNIANKPLSASMGLELKKLIDAIKIPTTLPNPQKLIFQGVVSAEYDGSGAVTITIPNADVERIEKLASDATVELEANKLYVFPEMPSLTYTLKAPTDTKITNEYHMIFKSGVVPTELVHPLSVKIGSLKVEPNKIYEISIMENLLTSQSWAVV